jgi:hypothetical protein
MQLVYAQGTDIFKHLSPLSENYGSLGPRDIKKSPWFSQLIVENHS